MEELYDNYKIVFTGPVASGKTTAINSISGISTVSTEETATDETQHVKHDTTVAMDYGLLKMPNGGIVHLYGTPGQERFSYMREILTEGALGLVLLINNKSASPFKDMEHYMEAFSHFINKTSLVIGVTHMDEQQQPSIKQYQHYLMKQGKKHPVFEVDPRNDRDIKILLQALLYSLP
jgi:signal recognition particle receptor subunit beta